MTIIETPWEIENLGVRSSSRIIFDDCSDDEETIRSELNKLDADYQEAVVPMGRVDLIQFLNASGFRFAEVQIRSSVEIDKLVMPKVAMRRLHFYACHEASQEEVEQILYTIQYGHIFKTDKIALNPKFGEDIAGRRYANWIKKEISDSRTKMYVLTSKGTNKGFMVIKHRGNGIVDGLLTGLFDAQKDIGIGYYLGYFLVQKAKEMGGKKVTATVSSNNLTVLRENEELGYKIQGMSYIMVK